MTSLSQQLQRLALPQNDPSLLARHEVASLLFDCKEAASIDRDTIFAIGCTGLEELIGIDSSFQKFESALFSQLAKSLERSVQTKAVNKQLDENISLFLIHLSPYFMLKPAQKCLEWLIHRFHIHLYNQDSLIGCVLPYHETKIFVRVIQLLKIRNPTHKWNWLEPVKMSGVHLAKGTLVTHCYKDLGFMDFICSLVTKSVKVFSEYPGSSAQLRVLLTFYASTIVSALASANDISDSLVAKLFPYIQKGLKSSLPDYRAATYMIICQVSVKVTMEHTFVHSLASQIAKTLTRIPSLIKDGLGCLIVLLQRQKIEDLGKKLCSHLCNVPGLVSLLHEISVAYDVSPLLHYMLPHLVVTIIHHVTEEEEEDTEELDSHIYARLLEDILKDISLENKLDHLLASTLLEEYISYSSQKETDSKKISLLNEQLLPLIRLLESKYPKTLDLVLEDHLKDITDPQKQEFFHQFISLSTSGGKFQFLADSDTCLTLSLNHPLAPVRLLAVNHLKNVMETSMESVDESFIKDAIIMRLGDDNLDVVQSAVNAFEIFKKKFSPEETVSSLLSLFQRAGLSQDGAWYKILELAADILIKEEILSGNDQLLNQVVIHLLPFMVVTNDNSKSQEMKMATYLSKSGICSLHPILKGWKEALEKVIKTTNPGELIGIATQKMVQLLADNIKSGNPSSMLKVVEDLVAVGEKESYTLKQKVTSQVIVAILVSCCSSLKETHFPFALRVFNLLERKIKESEVITSLEISFECHSELSDRGIPVEIWIQYIEKLNRGQMIAVEDAVMFVFSLKNFIQILKPPKSFLKDDKWWNPEHMKEDSRDYLHLLIQMFEVIIAGASALHFRALMSIFLKVHLEDVSKLFKFFSLLWTYNYSLSNPLNYTVKTILQTQALYIGHAVLSSQAIQKKKQLASTSSPVVTCLLINLGSPIREVRRAAILCLQALREVESPFHPIIQHLVQKEEEIISDATYVAQDLNTLFEDLQTGKKPKSHQKLTEALKHLLCCVHSCPSYIAKNLMKILQEVNSEMVLSQLLPTIDQLLEKILKEPSTILKDEAVILHLALGKYNEHSASLLHKDPQSLEIFIKAVHTTKEVFKGMPTFQILALGKITKPFFAAISNEKVRQKLLGMLFDLLLNCKNTLCAQTLSSVFKTISVDAEQIRLELEPPEKTKSLGTVQQTRRQKMQQKKLQDTEPIQDVGSAYWQRVTLILELLQHKKKLKSPHLLVPCLFNLLSRCLETLPPEQGNLEYTKQLILSCLLNICQKLSPDGSKLPKGILDEEKFNVELLVQCVRVSEMPQTHHHAFLLLGAVAGIFPDKVLHNIMPIFTFMGANVMRLDDTYSFQVIKKTVKMVIPALIQADSGDSADVTRNIEEVGVKIINVFVDALPHVPEHRRLPILVELVDTLGAEKFLWILLLLLFEQYVTKTVLVAAHGEKDAILETDTEFWISVSCEFTVQQQLQSLMDILRYLTELPEKKEREEPPKTVPHKTKTQEQMVHVFDVDTHTSKQLRHFTFLSVSFISQLLASHNFIKKVMEAGGTVALQGLEQRLLETVLSYINSVAQSVKENSDKLTAKFWRALLSKAYDMLDKVNSLLPTETFVPVIRGLLTNQLPSVRRKAMDLLNNKLYHYAKWKKGQVALFLKLVPDLLAIAQHKIKEKDDEQAINRQTALYSLKLLCKNFGTENSETFLPVLSAAINLINPEMKDEKNVLGSALLCIAEVTCVLGALAIPHLPSLMPALLTTLENTNELVASEVYLLSALAALQKVVETLPHFLSPYLHGILMQAIRWETVSREMGPTSQATLRVTSLKTTLATTLSPRVLLSALNTVYKQIGKNWKIRIGPFMNILQEHIAVMKKEDLNSHQSQLTAFFLEALNLRAQHSEDNLEEVGQTESCIINCVVSMVMKLSEVTFRPLFFKLFDWARTEDAPKDRLLTFCNLADCIAEKLKGLFTLFAGHLVKPFADTLNQINISKTDEAFFDSENEPKKSCLLLQFILDCLHKIFLFDTQHFVSKERAEALMMPLVDQLENMLGGEETFQERVTKHLIPCIAQFSVAMADDSLWKPLNYQILLKMRHTSPKVRFAALIAVLELAEKLRENYIVLLPESIPFLAELMEDECEEVENQCQKTIQQLEVILGEPLQSYF